MTCISVVVPVYDNVSALPDLLTFLFLVAEREGYRLEVIIVDDGSAERVWQDLASIKESFPQENIRLIQLDYNHGQHIATLCGLLYSQQDYLVTLDSDLQYYPHSIPVLIQQLRVTGADIVYGNASSGHGFIKRSINCIRRLFFSPLGSKLSYASSFRVMKRTVLPGRDELLDETAHNIDEYLVGRSNICVGIPVDHYKSRFGRSSYDFKGLIFLGFKMAYHSSHLGRGLGLIGIFVFVVGVWFFSQLDSFYVAFPVMMLGISIFFAARILPARRRKRKAADFFHIKYIR